jgi:lipopolysaccharide/colanic/teichoic acid biosynthesis glycosyltransferase
MSDRIITRSRVVAVLLSPIILVLLALLYLVVVPLQGRPFLYRSERMKDASRSFGLYKIRTMMVRNGVEESALGGDQSARVTGVGRVLRRTRLDELPQIFNVLRGDIVFIGPRPPLPRHLAAYPVRYRRLLDISRPGITGLSTVLVHRREERILSRCQSAAETESAYLSLCLPLKMRLDTLYAEHRGIGLDLLILWWTLARLFPTHRKPEPGQITQQLQPPAVTDPIAA